MVSRSLLSQGSQIQQSFSFPELWQGLGRAMKCFYLQGYEDLSMSWVRTSLPSAGGGRRMSVDQYEDLH